MTKFELCVLIELGVLFYILEQMQKKNVVTFLELQNTGEPETVQPCENKAWAWAYEEHNERRHEYQQSDAS